MQILPYRRPSSGSPGFPAEQTKEIDRACVGFKGEISCIGCANVENHGGHLGENQTGGNTNNDLHQGLEDIAFVCISTM
jgi:hypothetical protein